ncbi:MAG: ABC transporter permease [Firmicutes bacterium]|nr:ABC transporter permease [Bacillota bacterium]
MVEALAPEQARTRAGRVRDLLRYRNLVAGGVVLAILVLSAVFAPWVAHYPPDAVNPLATLEPPTASHLFGTDAFGRDIFARVLYGARYTMLASLMAVLLGAVAGSLIGLVAGMAGGTVDLILMRFVDLVLIFPGILPALAITTILGPSLVNVVIAIGISSIPVYARVVQGTTLQTKQLAYVESARATGAGEGWIVVRHVLPNIAPQIIVSATTGLGVAVLWVAALGFLGLGVQPPTPELGAMLNDGRDYVTIAWWVSFFPGLFITLYIIAVNLLGDGLRDLLDPHALQRVGRR